MKIPIDVEYLPYHPSTIGKTFVRTDVSQEEAFATGLTLCEFAIQICKDEGLHVTGNARVTTNGIFAPSGEPFPE